LRQNALNTLSQEVPIPVAGNNDVDRAFQVRFRSIGYLKERNRFVPLCSFRHAHTNAKTGPSDSPHSAEPTIKIRKRDLRQLVSCSAHYRKVRSTSKDEIPLTESGPLYAPKADDSYFMVLSLHLLT
jgi:hypothetical protein